MQGCRLGARALMGGLLLFLLVGTLLVVFCHVQRFVNHLRDWLDLCAKLLFDPVQGKSVVVGDQVDGNTQVTKPARSTKR